MEPSIQYATTRDGTSIAYYTMGKGPRVGLFYSSPFSHLEAEWQNPLIKAAFTLAAQDRLLIRLDPRGFGLSERDVSDFSVDAMVSDIEAVIERLGVQRLRIQALGFATVPAIVYAARHPDTEALVLQPPYTSWSQMWNERLLAIRPLIAVDWELASDTLLRTFNPGWPDQMIKEFSGLVRSSIDGGEFLRFLNAAESWDAGQEARAVRAKTLLIHNRNNQNEDVRNTRSVASLIPDAHIAFVNDIFEAQRTVQEFYFGVVHEADPPDDPQPGSETAIILFTDIADSTALTEQLGDATFRSAARILDDRIRQAMRETNGTPVDGKVLGDGVMGVFSSAAQAIAAARRCVSASSEAELPLHIGIHAGDIIREEANVYGGAVNIASRICGLCVPGEILVTQTVRDLARTSAGVGFEDRGEHELKGISDAMRVYVVRTV